MKILTIEDQLRPFIGKEAHINVKHETRHDCSWWLKGTLWAIETSDDGRCLANFKVSPDSMTQFIPHHARGPLGSLDAMWIREILVAETPAIPTESTPDPTRSLSPSPPPSTPETAKRTNPPALYLPREAV